MTMQLAHTKSDRIQTKNNANYDTWTK